MLDGKIIFVLGVFFYFSHFIFHDRKDSA